MSNPILRYQDLQALSEGGSESSDGSEERVLLIAGLLRVGESNPSSPAVPSPRYSENVARALPYVLEAR